jgi:hypothetical protein
MILSRHIHRPRSSFFQMQLILSIRKISAAVCISETSSLGINVNCVRFMDSKNAPNSNRLKFLDLLKSSGKIRFPFRDYLTPGLIVEFSWLWEAMRGWIEGDERTTSPHIASAVTVSVISTLVLKWTLKPRERRMEWRIRCSMHIDGEITRRFDPSSHYKEWIQRQDEAKTGCSSSSFHVSEISNRMTSACPGRQVIVAMMHSRTIKTSQEVSLDARIGYPSIM